MLTWSTSTTTKPNHFRSPHSKVAEDFLQAWDGAVFEGKTTGDAELDKEAAIWREKFPHLRIIGTGAGVKSSTSAPPAAAQKQMSQSKSAYTFREKNRETSLPRIDKFRKK